MLLLANRPLTLGRVGYCYATPEVNTLVVCTLLRVGYILLTLTSTAHTGKEKRNQNKSEKRMGKRVRSQLQLTTRLSSVAQQENKVVPFMISAYFKQELFSRTKNGLCSLEKEF